VSKADYLPADRLDPGDPDYAAKSEALSFFRIKELYLNPLPGDFDARHLKAIHGHLFQDSPDRHAPGQYRPESEHHVKFRKLEGPTGEYLVRYAPMRDEADAHRRINAATAAIHPDKLRGLSVEAFAECMAKAYAELDHIHPFKEGNSRTLRAFTAQASREAGFELDWGTSNATALSRNALYLARDKEVLALTPTASLATEHEMMAHARASHYVTTSIGRDGPDLRALVAQFSTLEQQAPRHDLSKSQASLHAEPTKAHDANLQALQDNPAMRDRAPDDLSKLAYWRGVVTEVFASQHESVKAQALMRFDKLAEDPRLLQRLHHEKRLDVQALGIAPPPSRGSPEPSL
jgi:fido (protein-threonine AMPylation protein)